MMIPDPESSKEIINEVKALSTEVYRDLASPALQEIGSVGGRTVKALLSPLRGMLWGWERIEEMVEERVAKRLDKIPAENKQSPSPEIAVPLLQALTYTAQNETLRDMFINLLANSMDSTKNKVVHPSFVNLIKQMNSLDAKVFERLSVGYLPILNPTIKERGSTNFFYTALPDWYIGWTIEGFSEFDVSASLVRLSKFGLIDLLFGQQSSSDYSLLKGSPYLQTRLEIVKKSEIRRLRMPVDKVPQLEINGRDSTLHINEYGIQFREACQ